MPEIGHNSTAGERLMPLSVHIVVPGDPVAKGRARAFIRNGKIGHFTPGKTAGWEQFCRALAAEKMAGRPPLDGPLKITVEAHFLAPKSWPAWKREAATIGMVDHTTKPDADNILKAAKDALRGVVYRDDAQITHAITIKRYSDTAAVLIAVQPIEAMAAQTATLAGYKALVAEARAQC